MKKTFYYLYIILCGINIIFGELLNLVPVIFATKPLLMPVLLVFFLQNTPAPTTTFRKWMIAALIFSFLGDTFLMFVENPPQIALFFLFGLGSFLITHLCYAISFFKIPSNGNHYLKKAPWWILFFLAFLIGNSWMLLPGIEAEDPGMKIPVVIYSAVIVSMALTCINLKGRVPSKNYSLLLLGVLAFVVSDTFIGINKFVLPESRTWARVLIMCFYLFGQLLIVQGAIKVHAFLNNTKV